MTEKEKKKKNKKVKKVVSPRKRKVMLALKISWLVILACILILFGVFYFKYGRTLFKIKDEAVEMVQNSSEETFKMTQTSLVYDSEGDLISKLKGEKDVYYLNYNDIPDAVKQAMISIEDKQFANHNGIDLKANIRAVVALVRNRGAIKQGASTITQQLSRNIFLTHEVSWERKVKEIFIALELEKKYPKYKILEFYLNNIYFANGYYGIQAASKGYFNLDVNELSLSQIAYLCAIPNNPTLYNPLKKPENTIKRRDRILKQMFEDGAITQEQLDQATAEEITLNVTTIEKQTYVDSYVKVCAIEALMEAQGFEFRNDIVKTAELEAYEQSYEELYAICQQQLFSKGYTIYTSIDMEKQKELQSVVDETLAKFTDVGEDGIYEMQGASVTIDNQTGKVVAIVGGRSQETVGYLNRAYQSYRQPGSSIKPLIVYAPALQKGYSPYTKVVDEEIPGGPSNSTGKYLGEIDLTTAVAKSVNTIANNIYKEITPKYGISFLYKMGFKNITQGELNLSAALGGFSKGVSPLEMAVGYATLENDGKYRKATCIVKIVDDSGKEIISGDTEEVKVYDVNASRAMTSILTNVLQSGGTGAGKALKNMSSAGKTGTTNDKKDGWFVGYTPYYTTSVWVGCDMPKTVKDLTGATYPLTIWNKYMTTIHKGLANKMFPSFTGYEPEPTVEPEETEAPEETATPEPEVTVTPTVEPVATVTPVPTVTPAPSVAPTATPIQTQKPVATPAPTQKPDESKEETSQETIQNQESE